jgi:hypothetical protein
MLSALLRAGRSLTAGLSSLSSADSILMSYVNQTGDNLAPEWKDGFDNAREERTLEAVGCKRWFSWDTLTPGC